MLFCLANDVLECAFDGKKKLHVKLTAKNVLSQKHFEFWLKKIILKQRLSETQTHL